MVVRSRSGAALKDGHDAADDERDRRHDHQGASAITFVGPNGWKYSRHVVDPAVLNQVKVGDQVDINWNTDFKVSVE